jgi:hypothetical protein
MRSSYRVTKDKKPSPYKEEGPSPYSYGDGIDEFFFWVGEFVGFLREWAAERCGGRGAPPSPRNGPNTTGAVNALKAGGPMPDDPSGGDRLAVHTLYYLNAIPREPPPPGQVVVHNRVRPTRQLGSRGFRAWTASTEPGPPPESGLGWRHTVERCDCGWAPELPAHYRSVVS